MKQGITQKQKIVLDFIKNYIDIYGYSPSVQNICDGCKIKSKGNAAWLIKALIERGHLTRTNKARTLMYVD